MHLKILVAFIIAGGAMSFADQIYVSTPTAETFLATEVTDASFDEWFGPPSGGASSSVSDKDGDSAFGSVTAPTVSFSIVAPFTIHLTGSDSYSLRTALGNHSEADTVSAVEITITSDIPLLVEADGAETGGGVVDGPLGALSLGVRSYIGNGGSISASSYGMIGDHLLLAPGLSASGTDSFDVTLKFYSDITGEGIAPSEVVVAPEPCGLLMLVGSASLLPGGTRRRSPN